MTLGVVNQKGGVGKTTVSWHIALGMAARNRSVLLVDLDPQGNCTSMCTDHLLPESNITLAFSSRGKTMPEPQKVNTALDLLGANDDLSEYESAPSLESSYILRDILQRMTTYDLVVIDTPTHLGTAVANVMVAADCLLIPVRPDRFDRDAVARLFDRMTFVREHANPRLQLAGLLVNVAQERTIYVREFVTMLKKTYNAAVFSTIIPSSVRMAEALDVSKPIWEYEPQHPVSIAWLAFLAELEATLWPTT